MQEKGVMYTGIWTFDHLPMKMSASVILTISKGSIYIQMILSVSAVEAMSLHVCHVSDARSENSDLS